MSISNRLGRLFALVSIGFLQPCAAQTFQNFLEENGKLAQEIKVNREKYLWGEGTGTSTKRADDEALAQLISQISVVVSSSFENEVRQTVKKGDAQSEEAFEQNVRGIISTYSQSALTNTERLILSEEPDAKVFRYVLREDVSKVFEDRKSKIYDYVGMAEQYEKSLRLADALRYYNWALTLLRSHPDSRSLTSGRDEGSAFMHSFITDRVNSILENVVFEVASVDDVEERHRAVKLLCTLNNEPIVNLDFKFWYGRGWSRLHSVKDGRTMIDFYGDLATTYDKASIEIEYAYTDQLFGDKELEEIFKQMDPTPFSKKAHSIEFSGGASVGFDAVSDGLGSQSGFANTGLKKIEDSNEYESIIEEVVKALNHGKAGEVQRYFTAAGYDVYQRLLLYGNAQLVDMSGIAVFRNGRNHIGRSVYMSFDFKNGRKSFVEEVVFHFDENKKISTIAFGLGEIAVRDIYNHRVWAEDEKLLLVDFLEQYKTAFALKRIDYLQAVFDDNAVIITGTVLKKRQEIDGKPIENLFAGNQIVEYNRFTKREYMQRLEHVFASKEFINLEFEDNTLRKSNANPNLFGIQIKQNYSSSNYSDQGYLFLLIDFTVRSEPTIHVRTWQPEKDPDGRIYGLEDF